MRRIPTQSAAQGRQNDRAVSDVLAFILVFGIILTSVATLSMFGFQAMTDYQEGEQQRNAGRAMESLAENFNDVMRYDGIEERRGELSLRDGAVTSGTDGTKLNVSVDGTFVGNHSTFDNVSGNEFDLGTFAYESDSDTVAYEGGAVVRKGESGSAVLKRPHLKCNPDTGSAVVSLVRIDTENRTVQSSEGVSVSMIETDRNSIVYEDDGNPIDVNVSATETPYRGAWDSIEEWDDGCTPTRVVVTITTVELDY